MKVIVDIPKMNYEKILADYEKTLCLPTEDIEYEDKFLYELLDNGTVIPKDYEDMLRVILHDTNMDIKEWLMQKIYDDYNKLMRG